MSAHERTFEMVEIGVAQTPLKERREAPQQPGPEGRSHERHNRAGVEGVLRIHPPYRACLADLGTFSHAWLLFVFDRNKGWKPKVRPPRGGPHRGLFATRGPHRPTSIGLTAVRVIEVTEEAVRVAGLDLLDGTPIVDIKPYLPFTDSHPDASVGWLADLNEALGGTAP
jgi:tRNA-Thr(GGU) m(6)t(6)A37 methyltransferase TsaA